MDSFWKPYLHSLPEAFPGEAHFLGAATAALWNVSCRLLSLWNMVSCRLQPLWLPSLTRAHHGVVWVGCAGHPCWMPKEELIIARTLRVVAKHVAPAGTGPTATAARVVKRAMAMHSDLFGSDAEARRREWAQQAKWAYCVVASRGFPAFPAPGAADVVVAVAAVVVVGGGFFVCVPSRALFSDTSPCLPWPSPFTAQTHPMTLTHMSTRLDRLFVIGMSCILVVVQGRACSCCLSLIC